MFSSTSYARRRGSAMTNRPGVISIYRTSNRATSIPASLGVRIAACCLLVGVYFALFQMTKFLFSKNPRIWIQPYTDSVVLQTLNAIERNTSALSLPAADGRRYVHFANQVKNVGFNNVLNEVILLAHLAHASGRVYVFRPLLLQRRPTLPLQAFIAGPAAGANDMAASIAHWDTACPLRERKYVSSTHVRTRLGLSGESDASQHMDRWTAFLKDLPDRCVEVLRGTPLVFDYDVVVSPKIISLWSTISVSPVVTHFAWSPLVERGLARTLPLLAASAHDSGSTIQGLVAVHVRRGDFEEHCAFLSGWMPIYTSWNLLPTLPDRYMAPSPQDHDDFTRRCYPTSQQIASRLRVLRTETGRNLERVYVATNGKGAFLEELKRALRDDGWKDVLTSRDLELPPDERIVDQGIDMEIAARAELFVGNGFSSLTATITMLRLTRGKDTTTIRFCTMRESAEAELPCTPSWANVFMHLASDAPDLRFQLAADDDNDEAVTRSNTLRTLALGGLFDASSSHETLEPTSPAASELLFPAALAPCTGATRIAQGEELAQRVQDTSVRKRARVVGAVPARTSTIVSLDVAFGALQPPAPRSPMLAPEPWADAQSFVSSPGRPHTPTLQSWLPPSLHAGRMPEPLPSPRFQRDSGFNWDAGEMAWASSAPTLTGAVPTTPRRAPPSPRVQLLEPTSPAVSRPSPLAMGRRPPSRMLTEPSPSFRRVSGYRMDSDAIDKMMLKEKKAQVKKAKSEANLNLASRAKGFVRRVVSGKDTVHH